MLRSPLLVALALLAGCHATFKKYAPTLGAVRPQIVDPGVPYVQLGGVSMGGSPTLDVAGAVINTVQLARSLEQTDRMGKAVHGDQVAAAVVQGIKDTLGQGPPFGISDDPTAPLLQVQVTQYGLEVPAIGIAGVFTYDMDVNIYTREGKRVYTNHVSCATDAGAGTPVARALAVVDNTAKLDAMSDAELNEAFIEIGRYCGAELVTQMRRHAG
jgi:hypothetical protein